jgi:hypothetical protein
MTLPLGAYYSLTESAFSPFQAEPTQCADRLSRMMWASPAGARSTTSMRNSTNSWLVGYYVALVEWRRPSHYLAPP